ncbi:ATP-grasp domain-containing protein [Streptomyces olivochromogenes]|uniref:ATP-grasp domain-containing protein n=1 Tax=Streptomyces olivochromogenes TaxID=1963 RepID=UPI001F34CC10|nr:ATP-grasp domain-containing protein [Streptomyces olivochromogenes]MCF3137334.1 ATP-grasp domain-containing protein [Streptomyces olivochromogenes]
MSRHIVVVHRWRDRHARYEDYLDHRAHQVTYVTTRLARDSVPAAAAAAVVVPATDDTEAVWRAVTGLRARFGPPDRLLALNEGDLDTAAVIRERLRCAGQTPAALARFRDKLTMNQTVARAGVPVPRFADAPDERSVRAFADRHGLPVVVKPRRGTASRGVVRVESPADLPHLGALPPEPRLVQEYCPDDIVHIDGLWTGERLGPWRASRYVNTCVDFTQGQALGSVEIDDPRLLAELSEFTARVAGALSDEPWVFHLEAFVGASADGRPAIRFLEAGYRVGGAEIPFVWREVHGIDLMRAAADIQLGRTPDLPVPERWRTGGWLLVPSPVPAPCRVLAHDLPAPQDPAEAPYAVVVPAVGQVIPRVGGYEHVGARFRFRGDSSGEVEKAVLRTAAQFRLECAPETPAHTGGGRPACGLDR